MDAITNLSDNVKQPLSDAMLSIRDAAGRFLDTAKDQVEHSLEVQKEKVADRLETICDVLSHSKTTLRDKGEGTAAEWLSNIGDVCHSSATYLKRHQLTDLGGELSDFVRERPQVVLGGMFLLGFLAARFLKSDRDQGIMIEQPKALPRINEPYHSGAI